MDSLTVEMWNEFSYRKIMNCSHDEYMKEPALMVDWFQKFEEISNSDQQG